MEELEITGKTMEEAMEEAEKRMGVSRDQLEVEVVKEGKSGVLGIGGEEAVIKVKLSPDREKDVADIAKEVLGRLLELMEIEAGIEVTTGQVPLLLNVTDDDLGILIGRRGQAMASLEYILKLIVARKVDAWLPLSLDIGGYKKRRQEALEQLALRLAEQVESEHRAITLEPMSAYERRLIHIALADHSAVSTSSVGEGEDRKVVILPKGD
jgi:spoIIIJ-associated protein